MSFKRFILDNKTIIIIIYCLISSQYRSLKHCFENRIFVGITCSLSHCILDANPSLNHPNKCNQIREQYTPTPLRFVNHYYSHSIHVSSLCTNTLRNSPLYIYLLHDISPRPGKFNFLLSSLCNIYTQCFQTCHAPCVIPIIRG